LGVEARDGDGSANIGFANDAQAILNSTATIALQVFVTPEHSRGQARAGQIGRGLESLCDDLGDPALSSDTRKVEVAIA